MENVYRSQPIGLDEGLWTNQTKDKTKMGDLPVFPDRHFCLASSLHGEL